MPRKRPSRQLEIGSSRPNEGGLVGDPTVPASPVPVRQQDNHFVTAVQLPHVDIDSDGAFSSKMSYDTWPYLEPTETLKWLLTHGIGDCGSREGGDGGR